MNREVLSVRSGISSSTIGRIERGDVPNNLETLRGLARGLDLPLVALIDAAEDAA